MNFARYYFAVSIFLEKSVACKSGTAVLEVHQPSSASAEEALLADSAEDSSFDVNDFVETNLLDNSETPMDTQDAATGSNALDTIHEFEEPSAETTGPTSSAEPVAVKSSTQQPATNPEASSDRTLTKEV